MNYKKKRLSIALYANDIDSFVILLNEIKKRLQNETRKSFMLYCNNQHGNFELVLSEMPTQTELNLKEVQKKCMTYTSG